MFGDKRSDCWEVSIACKGVGVLQDGLVTQDDVIAVEILLLCLFCCFWRFTSCETTNWTLLQIHYSSCCRLFLGANFRLGCKLPFHVFGSIPLVKSCISDCHLLYVMSFIFKLTIKVDQYNVLCHCLIKSDSHFFLQCL